MKKKLWDPIFGGMMIGLAMILTFYIAGRGLGASGALTRVGAWFQNIVLPSVTQKSEYLSKYFANGQTPLNDYLVFMAIGIVIGGFVASIISKDLKFEILKGPNISNKGRLGYALLGGTLVGWAARMAGGCTSGQALVGGAELSVGSWAFMFSIFIGGFAVAYFVRRQWI